MKLNIAIKPCIALSALAIGLASGTATADIGSDVQSFFNDINYGANTTSPGIYQGQQAGYFTGGGLYARTPVRSYTLASIQLPHFRAGCGGIDLYSGGFSFINAQQFTSMLQNIGSNAASLAFMLALQVVSPQIKGVLADVQSWAEQFNNMQMNSCQAAGDALGGALSLFGADEQSCVVQRVANYGEDYTTADTNCRSNPSDTGAAPGSAQGMPFTTGNLGWQAMLKLPFFQQDAKLAQATMNLTGTLIVVANGTSDPAPQITRIPSILKSQADPATGSLIDALLHGGSAMIYECSDADTGNPQSCVSVDLGAPVTVTITADQALVPQVQNLLTSIAAKIQTEQPLTSAESGLIASTTLPVYKYLTVGVALLGGLAQTDINEYSELIGKDLLYAYLMDLLKKVDDGAAHLRAQSGQDVVMTFQEDLRQARQSIAQADSKVSKDFDTALSLTNRTRLYEQTLIGKLSPAVLQSALFQARQ